MAEKNLEVKFLTLWIDEKQRWSRRIEKTRKEKKITKEKALEERRSRCVKR
jgi:hypothetical protein